MMQQQLQQGRNDKAKTSTQTRLGIEQFNKLNPIYFREIFNVINYPDD